MADGCASRADRQRSARGRAAGVVAVPNLIRERVDVFVAEFGIRVDSDTNSRRSLGTRMLELQSEAPAVPMPRLPADAQSPEVISGGKVVGLIERVIKVKRGCGTDRKTLCLSEFHTAYTEL